MNHWPIVIRPLVILITCLVFSCNHQTESDFSNAEVTKKDSIISCDTLFSHAVELVKLDSFPVFDGKHYMTKLFATYDNDIYEKKLIPFLNVFHDTIDQSLLVAEKKIDTIFTNEELSQSSFPSSEIITACYPQYSFISKDSVQLWLNTKQKGDFEGLYKYYSFSRPLLSASGIYLLIEMDDHCYGLCGSGMTYLYRKENNIWYKVWSVCRWVS
jgi:hypothetical protein